MTARASRTISIRPWNPPASSLVLTGLLGLACQAAPPPAPSPSPQETARARAGASLWAQADHRPDVIEEAERLVAGAAASAGRVSDAGKAGLSAALLLGPLADAGTVVTGRVERVRHASFPRDGANQPILIVSLSVTGALRGRPPGRLDYWTWSQGAAIPTVGAEVLVGLASSRRDARLHRLSSPGAIFSLRGGELALPGIRLATRDVSLSLLALEGGRP